MKIFFDVIDHFHPNFDESVPNPAIYHIRGNAQWRKSCDMLKLIYGYLNPVIIQCDKEMSIIDVCRKLHANETREQCYDLRQKQVITATGGIF